jgi:glycosyltransferase involved in cell wall biosynthesis
MDRRAAVLRAVVREADCVLAPRGFARERALELGLDPERTRVLPLGVLREPARARAAGPRRRFGFIGTLAPHKGAHVIVEAFRRLAAADASLEIHGSEAVQPAYVADLKRRAEGDARIRFHGGFAEGEQDRVLAGIDVLVLPSLWWENSPLTVLEALGAGRPVLASRTGGVPELVADGAGVLVPPGDVAALHDALAAVAAGRILGGAAAAPTLKTAAEHAAELEAVYGG